MRKITYEYMMCLLDKHRDALIKDLEKCMCLDCYNMVKDLNLTENDVELEDSKCNLCSKQKPCIKYVK